MSANKEQNLEQIKGIGKTKQKWLQNVLGIQSVQTLAAISPKRASAILKSKNISVSPKLLETWVREAVELELDSDEKKPDDWLPIAGFVIDFQEKKSKKANTYRTTAHFIQEDLNQRWDGLVVDVRLCSWIQEHMKIAVPNLKLGKEKGHSVKSQDNEANEQVDNSQTNTPVSPQPNDVQAKTKLQPEHATIALHSLQVTQGLQKDVWYVKKNTQPIASVISGNNAFKLVAFFESERKDTEHIEIDDIYEVEFYATDRANGNTIKLGKSKLIDSDGNFYRADIESIKLLPSVYRLQIALSSSAKSIQKQFFEAPSLPLV